MVRLYPLTYKNYYNRIAQKLPTIADYAAHICAGASYLPQIDFDPKDGVDTTQIIGTGATPYLGDVPDYVLITDTSGTNIISRWYVIEAKYNRKGQYKLTLHRDFWADFREDLLNSPAFIRKGWVSKDDPAIFNPEQMTFNQIKTTENLIKDGLGHGWIVGYYARPTADKTITIYPDNIVVEGEYASIGDFPVTEYTRVINKAGTVIQSGSEVMNGAKAKALVYFIRTDYYLGYMYEIAAGNCWFSEVTQQTQYHTDYTSSEMRSYLASYDSEVQKNLQSIYRTFEDEVVANGTDLQSYVGKYYKINNKYYLASIERRGYPADYSSTIIPIDNVKYPDTYTAMNTALMNSGMVTSTSSGDGLRIYATEYLERLVLQEVDLDTISLTIKTTVKNLSDAPYCMWSIPYGGPEYYDGVTKYVSQQQALKWASAIQEQLGAANYDVQLLPYCPRRDFIQTLTGGVQAFYVAGGIGTADVDYTDIKDNSQNVVAAVIWSITSTFSFENNYTINCSSDDVEFKVDHETRFIRLVSPNYNGQYEMTPEENDGINGLIINCTYKPYNPFIQVIPNFKRMYGGNFGDARGLICAGDYSIPQISDAWVNYELQNKNYQQSFNRNIQSLELRNKYARTGDILNAVTGTAAAGVGGATAGAVGGPVGAVVGGVVGTVGGAVTGAIDVGIAEDLRRDNIDLAKDQYGYRLGNIQAVPDSLTKVSALNNCFKIFPFVEIYEATDTEKQALRDKIKYDGMSIGRIGNIAQFRVMNDLKMVKGTFIRINGIEDDYHVFRAINEEFERGVFI